jgi:hypothetical protein
MRLTSRQATLIHGWLRVREFLTWDDVLDKNLTLGRLIELGCRARDVMTMQPDPREWALHAGATVEHARYMMHAWPAHPLRDLGADLGDVLAQRFTAYELVQMGVTHAELVGAGMGARFEGMFKFSEEEWACLGKTGG